MKLYELTEIYDNIMCLDLEEEELLSVLSNLHDELEVKAENIAKVLRNIQADISGYKEEEKRLYERRKAMENKEKFLKLYLQDAFLSMDVRKLKAGVFSFNIQKNPPSVYIENEELIPEEFFYTERKLDRRSLLEALKGGEEVQGAFMRQTEGLRIR